MSLQIGQQLGSFEITSFIGKGGMGEVFRARDTRLKRDVAIKVLPDEFSRDTDRVARFQREAESLAALNHPNIAGIYDLQQSGDTRFLILEFVEGDTLADILKTRGALPVDEALHIAKQICEALEAAHERGIIHRDLKPANVKITPDGKVKVLDFGLAKAFALEPSNVALSDSPTLSMAATNAGVILGTASYMSPEQAKGRTVDRRTDIFAFGALLYEMLTGCAAFGGDDTTEILSRVLQREPDWASLPDDVHSRIRELLKLCLQKDAKKRRQTIADVRIDIEKEMVEPVGIAAPPSRGARPAWIAFAVALLAAGLLAIPAVRHMRETPPSSLPEMRVEIVTPTTADPMSFALSPDGLQIVFVASGGGASRLWLRSLASTVAQPLAGTERAAFPFWSPNSRSIGFSADGKLMRLDIGGGAPRTLSTVSGTRGGTWNADGVILFPPGRTGPLFRVSESGGNATAVTKLDRQASHRFPYFLPDGRQFLFYAQGSAETGGIYSGSIDSAETERLTPADTAGVYFSFGWVAWVRGGSLVAQRLDLERKALTGEPVTLADGVAFDTVSNISALGVSASGMVAYRSAGAIDRQLTWFDEAGKPLGAIEAAGNINSAFKISPDGFRVAVSRTADGNEDVWLLDGERESRFTFDAAVDRYPLWSRDGHSVVFNSNRTGNPGLYEKLANGGAGTEVLLLDSPQDEIPNDWSVDGRFILYNRDDPETRLDLWVLPMEGERKPCLFLKTSYSERRAQFSPNGRWVAYMSEETGPLEIYIRPFQRPAEPGGRCDSNGGKPVSTAGGAFPRWGPNGDKLYYISPDSEIMSVPIKTTGPELEPGVPKVLFPTRIYGGGTDIGQGVQYDVARDGRFLINTVKDGVSTITLLLNWHPGAQEIARKRHETLMRL